MLAIVPASFFIWLLRQLPEVIHGHPIEQSFQWVAGLNLEFALRLDGLSLLFALLISGIGTLILFYTQGYFKGHPQQGRFLMYIIAFMASMLGLVLADHLLLVFIFWELTSFTSYLLIGFNHENDEARTAALQAMLITVLGGLFLLAGVILMAQAADTWRLSEIIQRGAELRAHEHYLPILILVCIGAFTKSAQFPFHFWLPNAMQAPTPASAYLHSSTMVKAGIYLLARLHPALGGTEEWTAILTSIGTVTFLLGAIMAMGQHVLKRLLAYTTVSALGAMVMLLGVGTATILVTIAFVRAGGFKQIDNLTPLSLRIGLLALLMILAAFATAHSTSRLRSILSMGVVGYGMALLFSFFGAPDLAMTQLVIETLTVILLALAFYHLPNFKHSSPRRTRVIDLVIALGGGLMITLLVLAALAVQTPTPVSDYYLGHSYKQAHGRNVVNVILVDFRALDTLGEITVLTIAALGATALLKLRPKKREDEK